MHGLSLGFELHYAELVLQTKCNESTDIVPTEVGVVPVYSRDEICP